MWKITAYVDMRSKANRRPLDSELCDKLNLKCSGCFWKLLGCYPCFQTSTRNLGPMQENNLHGMKKLTVTRTYIYIVWYGLAVLHWLFDQRPHFYLRFCNLASVSWEKSSTSRICCTQLLQNLFSKPYLFLNCSLIQGHISGSPCSCEWAMSC